MTLVEYIMDYGDKDLMALGLEFALERAENIKDQKVKGKLKENIKKIINGERDLFF